MLMWRFHNEAVILNLVYFDGTFWWKFIFTLFSYCIDSFLPYPCICIHPYTFLGKNFGLLGEENNCWDDYPLILYHHKSSINLWIRGLSNMSKLFFSLIGPPSARCLAGFSTIYFVCMPQKLQSPVISTRAEPISEVVKDLRISQC